MFLLPFSLFGVDFVDYFSSVVFLDYISLFNICCKAGLVILNSLDFCLSEKLSNLNYIKIVAFFFHTLEEFI